MDSPLINLLRYPGTWTLGGSLLCLLLALFGVLPVLTAIPCAVMTCLLLTANQIPHPYALTAAILLWFALWRIGAAVAERRKAKGGSTPAATPRKGAHAPSGKLSMDDPAVRVVVNDAVDTASLMLRAGKAASLISNGEYEGTIVIIPVSRNRDRAYQIAFAMVNTPDLRPLLIARLTRTPQFITDDISAFAPLVVFLDSYHEYYRPDQKDYLVITSEKVILPGSTAPEELIALCMEEILRRCPLAVKANDAVLHTSNVPH